MSPPTLGGGKLPGKTLFAGRRRATTRTSGFRVHANTTGGEFRKHLEKRIPLNPDEEIKITFSISGHETGDLIGYGLWFLQTAGVTCKVKGGDKRITKTDYAPGSWNKVGSMWPAPDDTPIEIVVSFTSNTASSVAVYAPMCGRIKHKHLTGARPKLLQNMYQFAPEALFIAAQDAGEVTVDASESASASNDSLLLKSCNRCGRFLPINVPSERDHLSFSNHCVASHRRPCKHATFGRLRNTLNAMETLKLDFGFQLECRYCKKFEVNAAHNPQRTSAQMKEDGARRRAFELLLAGLYGNTPLLRYRIEKGTELADDVWKRFGCACFKCGAHLPTPRDMHLDHTRPLALLWPLDGTATALCGSCNSEKRDRAPSEFYTPKKLAELSRLTGVALDVLATPGPNEDAIQRLLDRVDWFFDDFLLRAEMIKERDGKVTGELIVKALQKVLSRSKQFSEVDLSKEYDRRRAKSR